MNPVVRDFHPGMGRAVAERTILRKKADGSFESWGDVADRVAAGNVSLAPSVNEYEAEYQLMRQHLAKATLLMSGRHLQHGDVNQKNRNQEVFTNCSTAPSTFLLFLLLLNGSGVGRCYDDDMVVVDWDNAPNLRVVLDTNHADFDWSAHESVRDAQHKYGNGSKVMWHVVDDSREGWAKAVEVWETLAYERVHKDKLLILDFSKVRPSGTPIGGMQDRPASGPVPLMNAFLKAASIKGSGLSPWRQAMYVDHYFAECVLVGGARRAARMATKQWSDETVIDFIRVKRPVEYDGKSLSEVVAYRDSILKGGGFPPMAFLWSSNNSVTVDQEFWSLLDREPHTFHTKAEAERCLHAHRVWHAMMEASYGDATGEPGFINVDQLVRNDSGSFETRGGDFVGSEKYAVNPATRSMLAQLAEQSLSKKYSMIVNPCGEIALSQLGGYCVIADVVPFHADTLEEAEEAMRVATRALIRVNLMDCLYRQETRRTNRIGVGMTGVHEFAWKFFQVGFRDMVDPDFEGLKALKTAHPLEQLTASRRIRAAMFWMALSRFNQAIRDEAESYSRHLGVNVPHTMTTIKPAGTTSKLFGLTEGWHLPSMREFLRWVQFRDNDPLIEKYKKLGYPTRSLVSYNNTVIVGFPTQPTICMLGMGDSLITAAEATPDEQYRWLMLGEKYWITGVDEDGEKLQPDYGNQISYTLKYDPAVVGYEEFCEMVRKHQQNVRACSVMPQADTSAYEYQPETPVTKAEFEAMAAAIQKVDTVTEDVAFEHIDCATGACPVDFNAKAKEMADAAD